MGTQGGGITRYDGIEFKTYSVKEGLPSNKIFCIKEDAKHNLWMGRGMFPPQTSGMFSCTRISLDKESEESDDSEESEEWTFFFGLFGLLGLLPRINNAV